MKALSIRQPRATQIADGTKRMELRTWSVTYRGPLAIHASTKRRPERIRELGFVPEAMPFGALVGVVDLVDIVPLDAAAYQAAQPEHLSDAPFPGAPCYGWKFANARRLVPIPYSGRQGLFEVDDEMFQFTYVPDLEPPAISEPSASPLAKDPLRLDPDHPFALFTLPNGEGYKVALYQWTQRPTHTNGQTSLAPGALWGIELGGDALRAVSDHLLSALRAAGHRATRLAREHRTPFYLDERTGVRLALVFIAAKPLNRYDRIEAISHGVNAMSDEEAYYWFSKCSAGSQAARAQKALRVLLADN